MLTLLTLSKYLQKMKQPFWALGCGFPRLPKAGESDKSSQIWTLNKVWAETFIQSPKPIPAIHNLEEYSDNRNPGPQDQPKKKYIYIFINDIVMNLHFCPEAKFGLLGKRHQKA